MRFRKLHRRFELVLLIGLLTALPSAVADESPDPAAPAPSAEQIRAWIAELDDNRYLVREEATQDLIEAGDAALDALLGVANDGRPEPADRAVWILRRLGRSPDNEVAIAALERLMELHGRPLLVERAEAELAERSVLACQQRLAPLGAELSMQFEQIDVANVAPMLQIRLGPQWTGTVDDLRPVAHLRHQLHFRFEGAAVDDAIVKLFEEKAKLSHLQLRYTTVTPEAIDALKQRHPETVVYMRNDALLGVSAENHANGVLIQHVERETAAAAAGIVPGDIITSLDGHPLPDFDRLTVRIAQHQPGDTIDVEIRRGEERKTLAVTLGHWPDR